MEIPITQSEAWRKLQDDLGEKSFFEQGKDYQYLAILKTTPLGNYLYLPYGPVFEDKKGFKNALKSLKLLATREKAIFIRVEPRDPDFPKYLPKNAKKTKDLNPKETWLLDLTGNDDDLKARLPSRLLRYYKSAAKKGLTIETSKDPADLHYLLDLQKALASEKKINTFPEEYYKAELKQPFATLYLVRYQSNDLHQRVTPTCGDTWTGDRPGGGPPLSLGEMGEEKAWQDPSRASTQVIAAGLVFDDKTTRYNLQGAQSAQGRNLHATGILTIKLILDAKEKGLKTFDFWGIAPDGAPKTHPWAGFTAFKKTFAGSEQSFAGTYDIVLTPHKYRLYNLLRKLNRLLRK